MSGVFFQGNAPGYDHSSSDGVFGIGGSTPIIYYLPGTTNWGATWGAYYGRPTMLWNPQAQTGDGSFGVQSSQFGFNVSGTTNIPIVVEACTNLGGAWVLLQSMNITNGSVHISDPQWTNYAARFYRFRSP